VLAAVGQVPYAVDAIKWVDPPAVTLAIVPIYISFNLPRQCQLMQIQPMLGED